MTPSSDNRIILSIMLSISETDTAIKWYQDVLDAKVLWNMGSVVGLEAFGVPVILHEPVKNKFSSPIETGTTTIRIEIFADNPDEIIDRAIKAGAYGNEVKDYAVPWGIHRQGGFTDPFGHVWLVGDKSPLLPFTE